MEVLVGLGMIAVFIGFGLYRDQLENKNDIKD